jgi:hypothetical protein
MFRGDKTVVLRKRKTDKFHSKATNQSSVHSLFAFIRSLSRRRLGEGGSIRGSFLRLFGPIPDFPQNNQSMESCWTENLPSVVVSRQAESNKPNSR